MIARTRRPAMRDRRSGFTLMELLLVLVILVILGSMTVAIFGGVQQGALEDAAKSEIGLLAGQVDVYHLQVRQYPTALEDLIKKPSGEMGGKWQGPYVKGDAINKDPWGRDYRFAAPGKKNTSSYDIWSVGPDGQDGTDDDIGNW